MHRYSYITQYTTIEEIKRAVRDTMQIYAPYATYLGSSKNSINKRMKYKALVEILAVADDCSDDSVCEFIDKINERLGDFDEDNSHTVEYHIYRWVLRNVSGA